VNIISDKIVSEAAGSPTLSILLLVITPIVVTVVAVLVYTFVEMPISTALTRPLPK
jgi:peptidoglycan/LPS O-acetylase OafA/YrhL